MIHIRSLLFVAAAVFAGSAQAQTPTYSGLTYAKLGGQKLKLDLYMPLTGTGPYPLLICIHGGGWESGDRLDLPSLANTVLAQGFAVASVDYRLTSEAGVYGTYPVTFPAQIQDVKGAVRWLRANADLYHLDPTRFASFGPSAGGHLSELLALSGGASELEGDVGGNLAFSSTVQAAAAYFGASDLLGMANDLGTPPAPNCDPDDPTSPESALLGWNGPGQGLSDIKAHLTDLSTPYPALVLLAQRSSPLAWVDANDPPLFVAHGTSDTTVPTNQSTRLSAALYSAGVVHELRNVPGAGHGFGSGSVMNTIDLAAADFLRAKLVGPDLPPVGEQSCFGDGSGAACPCGNSSWSGARLGCKNSLAVGASLTAIGTASIAHDGLVLHGDSMTKGAVLFIQGMQRQVAGTEIVFGSGLRCVSGDVVRLSIQNSVQGSSQYPAAGQPSVSVRGGATAGATLHYQLWYRDGAAACPGSIWNLSNAVSIVWLP